MSAVKITKTITLPDGDVMTIRKLSAKHLRRAAEQQMFNAADMVERMSGVRTRVRAAMGLGDETPDVPKKPDAPDAEPDAQVEEAAPNPLANYDAHTLIVKGLTAVVGEELADDAAREAYVDDLSEEDIEYASEQVLRLASPKLFLTKAEREAEQKNG